jgi:hypothetical protein
MNKIGGGNPETSGQKQKNWLFTVLTAITP